MNKKISIILSVLSISLLFSTTVLAQVNLSRIGQTPGGAAYHVNYDSSSQRLFVGAGTSLWVYDMSNPNNPVVVSKRPFLGLITESILDNNVLFIAATNDGVYALDATSDTLTILDYYDVTGAGLGDIGAYDMCMSNDTLFIANKFLVDRIKYTPGTGFSTMLSTISLCGGSICVAERGSFLAVGKQPVGKIEIYKKNNLNIVISSWQIPNLSGISKLRFSDLNDSILYVCGGSPNLGFNSSFYALKFDGSSLSVLDSLHILGVPVLAAANIQNMDTRNDTLYLATGCAEDSSKGLPLSYIPVLDATGLPSDTMAEIDYINAGLWHFDVSLMDGTPYMATASEWAGVAINNITSGIHFDTLMTLPTGGWTQKSKVRGDTLWVAHEGWGLAAYKIDSLMFSNGYMTDSKILHLYEEGSKHFFVGDFEFLNDTLLLLDNGTVYNLKPWQQGGQADSLYTIGGGGYLNKVNTNLGERIIAGTQALILPDLGNTQKMTIYNPYSTAGILNTISVLNNVKSITVVDSTVFYGFRTDSLSKMKYLVASNIVNDSLVIIDSIATDTFHINSISVDNNIVAIGKGNNIMWYSWDGSSFSFIDSYYNALMIEVDIVLKNNYIYVADRVDGLIVLDITDTINPVAAVFDGKGMWKTFFGSQDVKLGDDGKIYLSDFNAGVIIIEAFDHTIGIDKPENSFVEKEQIRIYPNPSSSYITVEFSNPKSEKYTINIYNGLGQLVKSTKNITSERSIIETGHLRSGIYFIEVTSKSRIFKTEKLIIQ